MSTNITINVDNTTVNKTIVVQCTPEFHELIKQRADDEYRTITAVVTLALRAYLETDI